MGSNREPLKVGEKAAVYWTTNTGKPLRHVGEVKRIDGDQVTFIELNELEDETAHIKQCRRLKPKRKARELRLKHSDGAKQWVECRCLHYGPLCKACVPFREVKAKP